MNKHLTTKQKMIIALSKTYGANTFTVKQAQARFGIKCVTARIRELRAQGYPIQSTTKVMHDGRKATVYKMG
jgi:hypothetical protein